MCIHDTLSSRAALGHNAECACEQRYIVYKTNIFGESGEDEACLNARNCNASGFSCQISTSTI